MSAIRLLDNFNYLHKLGVHKTLQFLFCVIFPSLAFSHTNSIGFQATNSSAMSCATGSGSNCVNIEVFMGTYHNNVDAEGHAALFIQNGDGTESQVLGQSAPGGSRINFTLSHSLLAELPNFDGSNYWDSSSDAFKKLASQFELGTNYFFADGSNKSLTTAPTNPKVNWGSFPYIWGHQSAILNDVGAGIYRLDYDAGTPEAKADLSFDWYALPGISEAFFRVQSDGTVSIVMNPERFFEFASFSAFNSLDNAAVALEGVRPVVRTTATDVGKFFEELYNMPISNFYQTMRVISGDIHGQVNRNVLHNLTNHTSSSLNQFIRNQSNDEIWFLVNEISASSPTTSDKLGNTVDGSEISIGRNWISDDENFFGFSASFDERELLSISGKADITTYYADFYFGRRLKKFETNSLIGLSNSNIETDRKVLLDSMANAHGSNYNYHSLTAKSEVAKRYSLKDNISLKSSAGISYQLNKVNNFQETGNSVSRLNGLEEKLEQQQISVAQEIAFKKDTFGFQSHLSFLGAAHKQIMNSVEKEGRTLSLHDAHWEVGVPFDNQIALQTEVNLNVRLTESIDLNAGVAKHLSSINESKVTFSLSGSF